ncbi:hypothetical protein [uncultured Alistipes sp.]|jgi:hypothetical protein|uniref:hypothetical protein n=1 Tax=uncultured Alistipes sp. TaxID=538949 RepID=UPI0025CF6943|nr:hypothetical protein [uncultured Alistipes sp.]
MRKLRLKLQGSTLVETLIMMLVAGVVFLTVMDGLMLFNRLQARRTETLLTSGRERDGYFRTVSLVSGADSILSPGPGRLEIYRKGQLAELSLRDSMLVCRIGEFRDTLLDRMGRLRLAEFSDGPDTVEIVFGAGFAAKFAVESPAERYRMTLDEIEEGYGYEE